MGDKCADNGTRTIASNTILLYVRTIIVMIITLYVSRLILQSLGVVDFGIYNAVGGIVAMFGVISNSLIAATQRFITFELGKPDGRTSYVFSLSTGLHIFIVLVVLILGETIGTWFLNTQMNFPSERLVAVNCIFQFTLFTFIIQILSISYSALVIAKEKMSFFALVSIVEAFLKLIIALILLNYDRDRLIFYGFLMALLSFISFSMYYFYCKHYYKKDCRVKLIKNLQEYKIMGAFVGWNFFGTTTTVLTKQGTNILINIFFGVVVNAGRGVAVQVDNAVNQFISSFTTAIRPQITKTYAAGDYNRCFYLVNAGTKIIMYLSCLLIFPLSFMCNEILRLWLVAVPDYAVIFTQLSLIMIAFDALSLPLYYLMLSTGNIKNYQLVAGSLGLLVFPFIWLLFSLGCRPEVTYYVIIGYDLFRWCLQLLYLRTIAKFPIITYLKDAMVRVAFMLAVGVLNYSIWRLLFQEGLLELILYVCVSSLIQCLLILIFGLSSNERQSLIKYLFKK